MRSPIILALAAWPFIATPAFAQATDTGRAEVAVAGNVAPLCILGAPDSATVNLGQMVSTSGPRIGRVAALPSQQVNLRNSFCNFAGSAINVSVTALVSADTAALQPGFARAVNYTANVANWAAGTASATSAASAAGATPTASGSGATQPLPKQADLAVTLTNFTVPSDQLLVSGNYQGAVVITLGPSAG